MWQWRNSDSAKALEADPTPASAPIIELDDMDRESEDEFETIDYISPPDEEFLVIHSEREQELIDLRMQLEKQTETVHGLQSELRTLLRKSEKTDDLHRKELSFKDRLLQQKEVELRDAFKSLKQSEEASSTRAAGLESQLRDKIKALEQREKEMITAQNESAAAYAAMEALHKKSEHELALLKQQCEEQLKAASSRAVDLEEMMNAQEAKLQAATQGSQYQAKRADHLSSRLAEVEAQAEQDREQCLASRQEIASLQDQLEQLRDSSQKATEKFVNAQQEIQKLTADVQRLESMRQLLHTEVTRLLADSQQHCKDMEEANCRASEAQAKAQELQSMREKDKAVIEQLRAEQQRAATNQKLAAEALANAERQLEEKERTLQGQNAELSRSLSDTTHSVCTLTRRVSALEDEKQALLTELQDTKVEYARSLQFTSQQLQAQFSTRALEYREREKALESQLAAMQAMAEKREGEVGQQQRVVEMELAAAQQRVKELSAQLENSRNECDARVAELQRRADAAAAKAAAGEQQAATRSAAQQQEIDRLGGELQSSRMEHKTLQGVVADITGALQTAVAQREDVKRRGKEEVEQVRAQFATQMEEQETRLQGTIQQLQEQLKEKSKSVWSHSRQVAELRDSTSVTKTELAESRAEVERLVSELAAVKTTANTREQDLKAQQGKVSALETQLKAATAKLEVCQAEVAELRGPLAAAQAQASMYLEAQARVNQLQTALVNAEKALDDAIHNQQAAAATAKTDLSKMSSRCHMAESVLENLSAEVGRLKADAEYRTAEIDRCQEALQLAQEKAEKNGRLLKEALQEQDVMRMDTRAQVEVLQRAVAEKELLIASAECLADQKGQQIDELAREADRLRSLLEAKIQKLASAERSLADLKTQMEKSKSSQRSRKQHNHAEIDKVLADNPNCVPLRCTREPQCTSLPLLDKSKFVAPKTMSLAGFKDHIRQKLGVSATAPLTVTVQSDVSLPASDKLADIHEHCKHSDGYLHVCYGDK